MIDGNQIVSGGQLYLPPENLKVRNYLDSNVPKLAGRSRKGQPVNEVIIHESVTLSVARTVRVLQRRKLGVHFIIGPDGSVTQHGDLKKDWLYHAGIHNKNSVGIEIVTPFYPVLLRRHHPWKQVIHAPWAHKKRYVVPTQKQVEACAMLIDWLTSPSAVGLHIPRNWIGLKKAQLSMGRVLRAKWRKPGIYAHTFWKHSDGAWPVLYSWLRLEAGLSPESAYEKAIALATEAKGKIDLNEFIKRNGESTWTARH